jgi:hypothetical protein
VYIDVSGRLAERFYAENGLPPYGALSFPLRGTFEATCEEQLEGEDFELFKGSPAVRLGSHRTLRVR